MFKNAIKKINKFYELDLKKNSHADEMFDVLAEIIPFDSAAIFYLTPDSMSLEYGKNYKCYEDINIPSKTSTNLYNLSVNDISPEIQRILGIQKPALIERLTIKDAVLGIILIERKSIDFSIDEKIIFQTCTKIITALIKDLEISKVLNMQVKALQEGLLETNEAYKTIKKQNKQIKANEKLQNQFLANISHDLRTPLNSIIGFSEILADKIFGDINEKQEQYINDIRVSSIKLLGMINEILDITKLEARCVKLNKTDIDIKTLIDETCNILTPLFNKKGIQVIKNINTKINLYGDYLKLQQVMFNIIGNAIKYSPKNGQIEINVLNKDNKTIITIKDNGCGIDKKYHKKIFDKFFQVQQNIYTSEASTGLGLAIAKAFIKMHNGEISINSEINKGCEIIISIPIKQSIYD